VSSRKRAVGLGFGTESGCAVLVDATDDREVATAVHLCKDRTRAGP
jgi:ribulose kinase